MDFHETHIQNQDQRLTEHASSAPRKKLNFSTSFYLKFKDFKLSEVYFNFMIIF